MNNKFTRLIKDTFIFAIGNLGSKLILFLMVPLYTNFLTTSEYGTAELVFTISQLVIPIVSVAIWNGVIRFGLMKGVKPEDVLLNSLLIWSVGSLLIVVTTPLIGLYSPISKWKWFLCIYSIGFIINQIELQYLKVKDRNKLFAAVSLIQTAVLAGMNLLLLVYLRTGVFGYLTSSIVSIYVAATLIFFIGGLYKDLKKATYNKSLIKRLIAYSAPLIMNDLSWWLIHSSDKIMVEWMLSASALGLYTVASKIPGLINTFVNIFSQAWGVSSIREIESTNDSAYYSRVFNVYSMLSFGATICFVAIIKPFMNVYVGTDFISAWRYVPLLLLAASFSAISAYYGSMFGALQKSVECMWSTIIGAVVNVVLNYVCITAWGAWGAIIGTLTAYIVISMTRQYMVNKYIKMDIQWRKMITDILVAFAQSIAVAMDWHIYLVSLTAIIVFVINHIKELKALTSVLTRRS